VPNRSSTGKSRGYAGSPPWHTVVEPGVTISPPWTQLMPVCYGFTRWSYGGDTVHARRATVMPRSKPALFCSPVRPWGYGVVPVGPGVHTVATPGLKSVTVWTRLNGVDKWHSVIILVISLNWLEYISIGITRPIPPNQRSCLGCIWWKDMSNPKRLRWIIVLTENFKSRSAITNLSLLENKHNSSLF